MNAGTLTQALTASRYKANPTAGSREKQDDTVSFMDMFAQNLKDARKTGTKAADKKRDGAADSKAQEMGDTGRNQASVDQGKKSDPLNPLKTEHAGMTVKRQSQEWRIRIRTAIPESAIMRARRRRP